jgi:hypothetical protein
MAGAICGIIIFGFIVWRDGFRFTINYWLNPPSFSGPVEHFASLSALEERGSYENIGFIQTVFSLFHGLFASIFVGTFFGGFFFSCIALFLKSMF